MTRSLKAGLAIWIVASALHAEPVTVPELGRLDFPNSGAAEAQQAFVRGVLLLHSFEYDDAREAFQEARRIDPGFALAAWGEAMTHNHPLWRQQDRAAARQALTQLGETPAERLAKAPTERERGYLKAVEVLYGEGDKQERDRAYERAMEELARAYPDDLEARAFWALSILGTTEGVRDFRVFMRAGAVAEEVFAVNPEHPGAAHYLIHSYDDPVHAPLGLRAARVYDRIAPAASHAQHMISHIFVALGRWRESVAANVRSYEVSVERAARKGLGVDAHNFHAYHWLHYSYLQLGRVERAAGMLDSMRTMAAESGSGRALAYYAAMRAGQIVEAGAAAAPSLGAGSFGGEVADAFGTGYAAVREGDRATAASAANRIRVAIAEAEAGSPGETARYGGVTDGERVQAEVMALELEALLARAKGDAEAALSALREAARLESGLPLEYGPPVIVKPSHELLGELLLETGDAERAMAGFEEALLRAPRRARSLAGRSVAAHRLGRSEVAAHACGELAAIYADADPGVEPPASCGS